MTNTIENEGVVVQVEFEIENELSLQFCIHANAWYPNSINKNCFKLFQVLDGGWCLEVGLLVTGLGLLSHYLIGGIVMPLRLFENAMIKLAQYQICNFIRLGRSTGFLLGAFLVFTSAAMLWQVQ